jgi:hypothetical protein
VGKAEAEECWRWEAFRKVKVKVETEGGIG